MRLVIADDNVGFLKRLTSILGAIEGIKIVGGATDVPGAIALIRQTKPDAIILDLHMPGGSGFDVLRYIKTAGNPPVVIVLTVGPRSAYEGKCMAAGADYFFEKSSELRNMIVALRGLARIPARVPARRKSA